jgi:hypothetical protein
MEKKLISEINRYREIIGLDPILEQNRNSRVRDRDGNIEIVDINQAINTINENITNLATNIQKEIFSQIPVKLIPNEDRTFPKSVRVTDGTSVYNFPIGKRLSSDPIEFNSNVPLSSYLDEVLNTSETDQLLEWYNKSPHIKNEIDNTKITVKLSFGDNAIIKAWPAKYNRKLKYVVKGVDTNFDMFFDNTGGVFFRLSQKGGFIVEAGDFYIKIPTIIKPPARPDSGEGEPAGTTRVAVPETIGLDLVDVFNYDTTDIKDQAKYDEAINKFSADLKQGLQSIRGYKFFLDGQKLKVYGYASQDNNPSEKVSGKYSNCKGHGNGTRGDYNMCLSDYRAKKVAEDLQKVFDDAGLNVTIQGVGKGETTKFGKGDGWKDGKQDDETNLSPNRRITFSTPRYKG